MAVTWSITNTEYNNDSDKGVVHASWQCTDSEVVGAGYKAYASVTEANVIAWVKATLGSEEVTRVETKVAAQITKSKTPPTAWGVPW